MNSLYLLELHDGAKYKETYLADPAMLFEMEGGYEITRARFTRRPRRVFTLGFSAITNTDKEQLQSFWEEQRGGSSIIQGWRHPISRETIPVRFKQGSVPEYIRISRGDHHIWDVSNIVLVEV